MSNKISFQLICGSNLKINHSCRGSTIVEYSLLIGIVIAFIIILSPMVKRSTQGMVKIVADEIGVQKNAEQRSDAGLRSSDIRTAVDQDKRREEWRSGSTHSVQVTYDEQTLTNTITKSSLGIKND